MVSSNYCLFVFDVIGESPLVSRSAPDRREKLDLFLERLFDWEPTRGVHYAFDGSHCFGVVFGVPVEPLFAFDQNTIYIVSVVIRNDVLDETQVEGFVGFDEPSGHHNVQCLTGAQNLD